jgi:hypothetical protein
MFNHRNRDLKYIHNNMDHENIKHTRYVPVRCYGSKKTLYEIWIRNDKHHYVSHPALRNKVRCISYMRQEDNIYNNRVHRDKCHNNQSIIT